MGDIGTCEPLNRDVLEVVGRQEALSLPAEHASLRSSGLTR